jgi:hypothetical protein
MLIEVVDQDSSRLFAEAVRSPYRCDPNWVPPLPGEERDTFDPRRNPSLEGVEARRWVLLSGGRPVGRTAAFAPGHRPGIGYVGFFESPDDAEASRLLLDAAEGWLAARGRLECYGPIAVTPRDRIGLLIEGFERPPMLFTPYNPPYYRALLERAGWTPHLFLGAFGWDPAYADPRGVWSLADRASAGSSITIRRLRTSRLGDETRLIAHLINETLADAWHFDPITEREAADMARLLRPILDPSVALIAEDRQGPCGVALGLPDVNWLWRRAGGTLWPFGWARLLRWRRHIPQLRILVLGLAGRVQTTGLAARLIADLLSAGLAGGYRRGELSQIYEQNGRMSRMLVRMGFPPVRRYAVFTRHLEATPG